MWAVARLGFDVYFYIMMNHTDYDLCTATLLLMKKFLQLPFTGTICYLQFVKDNIDTDSAQRLIQGDLRKFDPEVEHKWVLYWRMPWEGYLNKKFNNRKEEFETNDLRVECKKGKVEDLLEMFWWCQKSGLAAK